MAKEISKESLKKDLTSSDKKLARKRLSALELANELKNVAEACRKSGISRSRFYDYKRRFQTHGFAGLVDLPPIHKSHPQTTSDAVVEQILSFSMVNPMWGCNRLSAQLKLQGICVSGVTIQKILEKHNLGSKYERLLALEAKHLDEGLELTAEQISAIEKANPVFRERHVESSRPGELLCQDTLFVGNLKGVGKVYLQAVVDAYGSYAFGYLHTGKIPEHAATIIHNDVIPQYLEWNLPITAILTDNGPEFKGKEESHPYELYLQLNDIEHRKTKIRSPQTNGFVERFNRTVLDEFFRPTFRTNYYLDIESLQNDLNTWLYFYNNERVHLGYRNRGKRPIETVNLFTKNVSDEA